MAWLDSIVPEIASRRAIFFIGSGTSAFSTNSERLHPPTWNELLQNAMAHFIDERAEREYAEELIRYKQYLDAAEIIFSHSDNPEYDSFFTNTFRSPNFQPAPIHQLIYDLDPKIVISTNYDTIYEKQCNIPTGGTQNPYVTKKYYETGILDIIRSPIRLIIKAHGCETDPHNIILTRSQYFEARAKYQSFYSLLDSLFHTSTVIFVGCGLSDPDIQLILENANILVPCGHPHYAFVPNEKHPVIKNTIRKTYNIKLLEYDNQDGTHNELIQKMTELKEAVESYRYLDTE